MTITFIIGSQRIESNSAKIANLISQTFPADVITNFIDLGKNPLPLWDEKVGSDNPKWQEILTPLQTQLEQSDGYVLISPEYNGCATPAIKNFLLLFPKPTLAHKPVLVVGVSSSLGGAYVISDLRANGYKNPRLIFVPDHLIIRNASVLPTQIQDFGSSDTLLADRIKYSTKIFLEYVKALKTMRQETTFDYEKFANGM